MTSLKHLTRKCLRAGVALLRRLARPLYRALHLDVARLSGCRARLRVDPFTEFGRELLTFGERPNEAFTVPLMKTILRPGDVYCDVGAHWGTYTVAAAEFVGARGRVIAVEPTPQNRTYLLDNIALNRLQNVTLEPVAIAGSSGRGVLRFRGDSGNLSALELPDAQLGDTADEHTCEVATLSAVLDRNNIRRARLMKMDIEGGECRASRDVSRYAHRFDCICIELHPPFTNPAEDTTSLYQMLGEGRFLFVVDCAARQLIPIRGRAHFEATLGLYYFVSALANEADLFPLPLEEFRW
jgi:FkbM family methyltransferase